MRPIVVVSQVALDERNGAGMRAILQYLLEVQPPSVHSIFLANYPGATTFKGRTGLADKVHYEQLVLSKHSCLRLLSLCLKAFNIFLLKLSPSLRNNAVFLVLPDSIRDVALGLVCRLLVKNLVVWVMDDFPYGKSTLKDKIYQRMFGLLYSCANKRIVISHPMDKAYSCAFNVKADHILGKTLTKTLPSRAARAIDAKNSRLRIVYLGSFLDYSAEPIKSLIKLAGVPGSPSIEIALYGIHPVPSSWGAEATDKYRGALPANQDEVLKVLSQYDFALLPYSFDEHSIKTMMLSFPSKLVDYLGAALPVITIAPVSLSAIQSITAHAIGPIIHDASDSALLQLLQELSCLDPEKYKNWSINARKWAEDSFLKSNMMSEIFSF